MRLTTEKILEDIEFHLRNRNSEEWNDVDKVLLKAQLHILELKRQLEELIKSKNNDC